ncbi:uncharacterized protein LOC119180216 isoform X3 [Rhipicephalus microplus]
MSVAYAITSLVDSLDDAECLVELVRKIAISHTRRPVTVANFEALRILQNSPKELCHHTPIRFPAHVGQISGCLVNLNEFARSAARVLTDRADTGRFEAVENWDAPSTYNEITKHFYLSRRVFPPPSPKLSRPQALTSALLQTESYQNPHVLHAIYPGLDDNIC